MEERLQRFSDAKKAFIEVVKYYNTQPETFSESQTEALTELRRMWSVAHPVMGIKYFYWMKKLHEKLNDEYMVKEPLWIDYLEKSLLFRMSYGTKSNGRIEIINNKFYEVTSDIGLYEEGDPFDRNNIELWKISNFKYPFSLNGLQKSPFV